MAFLPRDVSPGEVAGPSVGELSRRSFMRRVLGVGVGLLSLEFFGGSLAFLWPNLSGGFGGILTIGSVADIEAASPGWTKGVPYSFTPGRLFLINAPAARALAMEEERVVTDLAASDLLALWRKCPHLGCQIPALCDERKRFECLCHGSTFNILGEKLKKGPAPRGMDRFAVSLAGGVISVDTSTIISGLPAGTAAFTDPHPTDQGCRN